MHSPVIHFYVFCIPIRRCKLFLLIRFSRIRFEILHFSCLPDRLKRGFRPFSARVYLISRVFFANVNYRTGRGHLDLRGALREKKPMENTLSRNLILFFSLKPIHKLNLNRLLNCLSVLAKNDKSIPSKSSR